MTRVRGFLLLLTFLISLAACSGPGWSRAEPTIDWTSVAILPTVTIAPTVTPTIVPTLTPTPTPFVTAPAAGQSAIVPILMYHHLADLPRGAGELDLTWTVSPKSFEAQIGLLASRGFHTISMGQLSGHLRRGQTLPVKPIVISFDDGWAECYSVAFPILKKHNFIGTFFVYTDALDHGSFLSWAQLQEMSAAGMDIQSHTVTHPHLSQQSPAAALKELSESKAALEKRLGKPVSSIDFPFGEYNSSVLDLVKRAGYESAVTLAAGYKQRPDEVYTLHRIRVSYGDTLENLASRLP